MFRRSITSGGSLMAHSSQRIDQLLTLLLKRVEERNQLAPGTLAKLAVEYQVNKELLEEQGD